MADKLNSDTEATEFYPVVKSRPMLIMQMWGTGPSVCIKELDGDWDFYSYVPETEVLRAREAGYCGA